MSTTDCDIDMNHIPYPDNHDNVDDSGDDDDSDAGLPIASGVVIQDRQVRVVVGSSQLVNDDENNPIMQGISISGADTSAALASFDFGPMEEDPLFQDGAIIRNVATENQPDIQQDKSQDKNKDQSVNNEDISDGEIVVADEDEDDDEGGTSEPIITSKDTEKPNLDNEEISDGQIVVADDDDKDEQDASEPTTQIEKNISTATTSRLAITRDHVPVTLSVDSRINVSALQDCVQQESHVSLDESSRADAIGLSATASATNYTMECNSMENRNGDGSMGSLSIVSKKVHRPDLPGGSLRGDQILDPTNRTAERYRNSKITTDLSRRPEASSKDTKDNDDMSISEEDDGPSIVGTQSNNVDDKAKECSCNDPNSTTNKKQQLSWDEWFDILRRYMEQKGSGWVPLPLIYEEYKLGQWAKNQRMKLNKGVKSSVLSQTYTSRIDTLNNHGFLWTPCPSITWEDWFEKLSEYVNIHGTGFIPTQIVFKGASLGQWVEMQRRIFRGGSVADLVTEDGKQKVNKLNNAGFVWKPEGCCDQGHKSPCAIELSDSQKEQHLSRGGMSLTGAMDSPSNKNGSGLTFDSWLRTVRIYGEQTGSGWIKTQSVIEGRKVGDWVAKYRAKLNKSDKDNPMSSRTANEINRLIAVGVLFEKPKLDLSWTSWCSVVESYVRKNGEAFIPPNAVIDLFPIGEWAQMQRRLLCGGNKSELLTQDGRAKVDQLNSIGFIWNSGCNHSIPSAHLNMPNSSKNYLSENGNGELWGTKTTRPLVELTPEKFCFGDFDSSQKKPVDINHVSVVVPRNNPGVDALGVASTKKHIVVDGAESAATLRESRENGGGSVQRGGSTNLPSISPLEVSRCAAVLGSDQRILLTDYLKLSADISSAGTVERALLKNIENKWLAKSGIDGRISKAEERDLIEEIDMRIGVAESEEYMERLDQRIRESEFCESDLSDPSVALASQRMAWPNPKVWHDQKRSLTIYDYTGNDVDLSSWELALRPGVSVSPRDLIRKQTPVSRKPFEVEVPYMSLTVRRIYRDSQILSSGEFNRDFVEKFNEKFGKNVKYTMTRMKDDASKWQILVRKEGTKPFELFQTQLEQWESRRVNKKLLEGELEYEKSISSLDTESFESNESLTASARKPVDKLSYKHFHGKYREVVETEFKSEGIHYNTAISSMWRVHKRLFGETCSDECKCVFNLPDLTSHVVDDYFVKLKKKNDEGIKEVLKSSILRRGELPAEFAGNFASRFLPKLAEEFPDESPRRILERLSAMWKVHIVTRVWGMKCKSNCECIQGWEDGFSRGNCSNFNIARISATKSQAEMSIDDDPTSGIEIPKKRKAKYPLDAGASSLLDGLALRPRSKIPREMPEAAPSSVPEAVTQQVGAKSGKARENANVALDPKSLIHSSTKLPPQPLQRQSDGRFVDSKAHRDSNLRRPDHVERREYGVDFSADSPLGYYFHDKVTPTGRTNCTVHSVCPGTSRENELRIQQGTIVVAVTFEGRREYISGTQHLKKIYENARMKEDSTLTLWLVNKDLSDGSQVVQPVQQYDTYNDEWCANGCWRGQDRSGWAGGAEERPIPHHDRRKHVVRINRHVATGNGTILNHNFSCNVEHWKKIDLSSRQLCAKTRKSILRSSFSMNSVELTKKKSVVFNGSTPDEWKFEADAPTTEFFVNSTSPNLLKISAKTEDQQNLETAKKKMFQERVTELQQLFQLSPESIVHFLNNKSTERFTDDIFTETRKFFKRDSTEDVFRHNLLKLLIQVAYYGPEAKHLYNWTQMELTVDGIDFDGTAMETIDLKDLCLVVHGTRPDSKEPEDFEALRVPVDRLSDSPTTKAFAFNPNLTPERKFEVQIRKNLETIGMARIMLREIYQVCMHGGDEHFLLPIQCVRQFRGARIRFRARRLFAAGIHYTEREKRKKFKEKLQKDVIDDLLKTIIHKSPTVSASLSPDAARGDGLTLLQIAVHFELAGAVENLLRLEADPQPGLKSLESLFRKLKHDESSTLNNDDSRQILFERRKRLENIEHILRKAATRTISCSLEKHGATSCKLQRDWLHYDVPTNEKCRNIEAGQACQYGLKCTFMHVQPLWGTEFDRYYNLITENEKTPGSLLTVKDFVENMKEVSRVDGKGEIWCTAGYKNRRHGQGQRVVYAEAKGAERNESGVCWFRTRENAKVALWQSVILSIWSDRKSIRPKSNANLSSSSHEGDTENSVVESSGVSSRKRKDPPPQHEISAVAGKQARSSPTGDSDKSHHRNSDQNSGLYTGYSDTRPVKNDKRACESIELDNNWSSWNDSRSPSDSRHGVVPVNVPPEVFDRRMFIALLNASGKPACKYFSQGQMCKFGRRCTWPHYQNPLNTRLIPGLKYRLTPGGLKHLYARDRLGKTWHTLGYHCLRSGIFYFPEKNGGVEFSPGVWWYSTPQEAESAVANVVASSSHLTDHGMI